VKVDVQETCPKKRPTPVGDIKEVEVSEGTLTKVEAMLLEQVKRELVGVLKKNVNVFS